MFKMGTKGRTRLLTQPAPWGGNSSTCEGATQVIVGIIVTSREMRAGQPENGLDSRGRHSLRQQVTRDPQIDNAPIGLGKAVGDPPALHTTPVDSVGLLRSEAGKRSLAARRPGQRGAGTGRQRLPLRSGSGRLQQGVGLWRPARAGVHQSDPWSMALGRAARGLLVGETGESSQMTPVGARRIAAIGMRQPLARSGRHRWFQGLGTETNPSLKAAEAGLHNHTWGMPLGPHGLQYRWLRDVEIDKNIAGVFVASVGVNINIASLAVAGAQKADGADTHQLLRTPQPLAWKRASALILNQADQIQFTRHRRQLSRDGVPSQKQSPVVHGSVPPLPGSSCNDNSSSAQQLSADGSCLTEAVSQNGPQSTQFAFTSPELQPRLRDRIARPADSAKRGITSSVAVRTRKGPPINADKRRSRNSIERQLLCQICYIGVNRRPSAAQFVFMNPELQQRLHDVRDRMARPADSPKRGITSSSCESFVAVRTRKGPPMNADKRRSK